MRPSPQTAPPEHRRGAQRRTIVVCEDDATLRELVRLALGDHHRFVEAADGDEALAALATEQPDLVVLDLMLPRRSGLEILRELRRSSRLAAVPVVVITAWTHADHAAIAAGADRFVAKPFDPDDLRATVDVLLAAGRAAE